MSLSCPWVYYRSSPLLGGQLIKANEHHLLGVSLFMLRQVPVVTLSFWLVSDWRSKFNSGSLPLSGCFGPVWSSPIPVSSDYVHPNYPKKNYCFRPDHAPNKRGWPDLHQLCDRSTKFNCHRKSICWSKMFYRENALICIIFIYVKHKYKA